MPSVTTAQKFRIRENSVIVALHPPAGYETSLGPLPDGVKIKTRFAHADQVHWFVKDRDSMESELDTVMEKIKDSTLCWIFYPKGSSGIQTDLTRDKGWDKLMARDMQWISLVSFNEDWSAFGMRTKTEKDKKREAQPAVRPVFDYIDPKAKTVRLPDDLQKAFASHAPERSFFETLSFTNKKEYVEWIVSAKRTETRQTRIDETILRLGKRWKNPANR